MEIIVLIVACIGGFGFLLCSLLMAMANDRRIEREEKVMAEAKEARKKAKLEDPKAPWNYRK